MHKLYSWALILVLNGACTTTSTPVSVFHRFDELEMSREFSSQTIASKSFVIQVSNMESPQDASQLLQSEFARVRPELQVATPRLIASDEKKLHAILKRFGKQQELPGEAYDLLQKPALASSWFLIADLERVATQQNVEDEEIKDHKGRRIETKYSFTSSRDLSVRYFIYDPAARHLVFSGLVRSTTAATHDRIGSGDERDYPEYPSLEKALGQNFEKFLRALPSAQGH